MNLLLRQHTDLECYTNQSTTEMHWRAIRHSTSSCESSVPRTNPPLASTQEQGFADGSSEDIHDLTMDVPLGHDNAADARAAVHEPRLTVRVRAAEQETETVDGIDDGHDFLQVSMPSFSTGITTFAYQRALRNRILNDKLRSGGEISMSRFTPTFIHDCLMLPGSLSNLLMKVRSLSYRSETRRTSLTRLKGIS